MEEERHASGSSVTVVAEILEDPLTFDCHTAYAHSGPCQVFVAAEVWAVVEELEIGRRLRLGSSLDQDEHLRRR